MHIINLHQFYQRLGYTIVGVIPDANGPGKPDIVMTKWIGDVCDMIINAEENL
jgi:hypothetical protein